MSYRGNRFGLAVALCALATSFVAPATQASPPVDAPDGRKCSYAATSDPHPDQEDDAMTGQVNGGPLLWDRDFWLHCRLKVDEGVHAGSAADVHEQRPSFLHDGDSEPDEVALLADEIAYESPTDSRDYLCTSVSWPAATGPNWLYWHGGGNGPDGIPGTADDVAAHWTTDANVPCGTATQVSPGPPWNPLDYVLFEVVDPAICVALTDVHDALDPEPSSGPQPGDALYVDAEGDVFVDDGDGITEDDWRDQLFWDCPGYVDYWSDPWQPGADGYPVIDVGASRPPPVALGSAVLGYVAVTMSPGDAAPAYTLAGELAVPALWTCSATPYVSTQPFTVTCDPVDVDLPDWTCGAVHADVTTTSAAARARTALHCDGDATPEAKTHTVTGAGGHDSKAGPTLSPVVVTQLRCTVSDGLGAAPVPGFVAGCGDPAAASVEVEL